jgi:uncharacterized membrane protein YdjX (TVP38/TMEM64 family)
VHNKNNNKRVLQIAVIGVFLIVASLAYFFNLEDYLSFDMLKQHRQSLLSFVNLHRILSSVVYVALYITIVTFALPGTFFLSVSAGFLFGWVLGTINVVIGASIGAIFIFLLARFALADMVKAKTGPWLQKIEKKFQEDALSYLLVLRLIPVIPFFIVNLVSAVIGVRLRTYFIATVLGVIPGAYFYVTFGTGLGEIFDLGKKYAGTGVITPGIFLGLCGLAFIAMLPVIYKIKFKKEMS